MLHIDQLLSEPNRVVYSGDVRKFLMRTDRSYDLNKIVKILAGNDQLLPGMAQVSANMIRYIQPHEVPAHLESIASGRRQHDKIRPEIKSLGRVNFIDVRNKEGKRGAEILDPWFAIPRHEVIRDSSTFPHDKDLEHITISVGLGINRGEGKIEQVEFGFLDHEPTANFVLLQYVGLGFGYTALNSGKGGLFGFDGEDYLMSQFNFKDYEKVILRIAVLKDIQERLTGTGDLNVRYNLGRQSSIAGVPQSFEGETLFLKISNAIQYQWAYEHAGKILRHVMKSSDFTELMETLKVYRDMDEGINSSKNMKDPPLYYLLQLAGGVDLIEKPQNGYEYQANEQITLGKRRIPKQVRSKIIALYEDALGHKQKAKENMGKMKDHVGQLYQERLQAFAEQQRSQNPDLQRLLGMITAPHHYE